jgi:acetoin utilization deacetylase AcuC-like enzyme
VYQSGVDTLAGDRLGRTLLTRAGLRRRDALVFEAAAAAGSRVVATMGGGYPADLDPASGPFREVAGER